MVGIVRILSPLSNKAFFSLSLLYDWDKYSFNLVGPLLHNGVKYLRTSSRSKFLKAHRPNCARILLNKTFNVSVLNNEINSYIFDELNNLVADS